MFGPFTLGTPLAAEVTQVTTSHMASPFVIVISSRYYPVLCAKLCWINLSKAVGNTISKRK